MRGMQVKSSWWTSCSCATISRQCQVVAESACGLRLTANVPAASCQLPATNRVARPIYLGRVIDRSVGRRHHGPDLSFELVRREFLPLSLAVISLPIPSQALLLLILILALFHCAAISPRRGAQAALAIVCHTFAYFLHTR